MSWQGKGEILDLLSLLKEHQAMEERGFLKEVQIGSTPCAILASKQQLDNIIVTYCCQPTQFSVFGVDATFELGDFYVTLKTLPCVIAVLTTHPFFLGPHSFTWSVEFKVISPFFKPSQILTTFA